MSVLYPGQLAPLLGIDEPEQLAATRVAWDLVALCDAWGVALEPLGDDLLLRDLPLSRPDAHRPMSIRDLAVNVFHPIALLPEAWETGRLEWYPEERDEEIAEGLPDRIATIAYASAVGSAWTAFVADRADGGFAANPLVWSPRGELFYDRLLTSQRWHAAFHYAQLVHVLTGWGSRPAQPYALETMVGLQLPASVV